MSPSSQSADHVGRAAHRSPLGGGTCAGPLLVCVLAAMAAGCEQAVASDITVEALHAVEPSLPPVPTLPPPPYEITYSDGSYSVYGLRTRMEQTISQNVEVSAFIVRIYEPPACPTEEPCAAPPHFFVADDASETDRGAMLRVVGYAARHEDVERAVGQHQHGHYRAPDPASGEPPIPVEMAVGIRMKLVGQFTRVSPSGFSDSGGLLDLKGYEVLATAAP